MSFFPFYSFLCFPFRYRYTEWSEFRRYPHFTPDWGETFKNHSVELYDHMLDPEENMNLAFRKEYEDKVRKLSEMLHAGWRKQLPQY